MYGPIIDLWNFRSAYSFWDCLPMKDGFPHSIDLHARKLFFKNALTKENDDLDEQEGTDNDWCERAVMAYKPCMCAVTSAEESCFTLRFAFLLTFPFLHLYGVEASRSDLKQCV